MPKRAREDENLVEAGEWRQGLYQEPEATGGPVRLHARYGHNHWSVGSSDKWEYCDRDIVAQLGSLDFAGFSSFSIARIEKDCITLTARDDTYRLAPGDTLRLANEIDGREWSDGCVYDGDDYSLVLTWPAQE